MRRVPGPVSVAKKQITLDSFFRRRTRVGDGKRERQRGKAKYNACEADGDANEKKRNRRRLPLGCEINQGCLRECESRPLLADPYLFGKIFAPWVGLRKLSRSYIVHYLPGPKARRSETEMEEAKDKIQP